MVALVALRGGAELLERTRGASWIWGQESFDNGLPVAFWAARDIEFDTIPTAAELRIVADEAYVVWVNGWWAGSGTYRQDAPPDVWQVGSLLQPGSNRLLVELRSERGAGGLWAELEADGGLATVSDRHWRIFDRSDAGVEGGWGALDGGRSAVVWGSPPRGRWRLEAPAEALAPAEFGPEHRAIQSRRSRANYEASPWYGPPSPGRRLPKVGPILLYDFGQPVSGYLELRLPRAGADNALLYFGLEQPPDLYHDRPQELVIPIEGAQRWRSASARRFRYVLVAGMELRQPAWVEPLDPARAGLLASPRPAPEGVFGLPPIRSRSWAEEAIWNRLAPG